MSLHAQPSIQGQADMQEFLENLATLEEQPEAEVRRIEALQLAIGRARFPYKNMLQSLLADAYARYYLRYLQRLFEHPPEVVDTANVRQWDIELFQQRITHTYLHSLQPDSLLQATSVSSFRSLFEENDVALGFHPTLYDLLAHRALNYFTDPRSEAPDALQPFRIKSRQAFVPANSFVNVPFQASDTNSGGYQAVRLFQRLLEAQDSLPDLAPWVYTNIRRLTYGRKRATGQLHRQRFANALQHMLDEHAGNPAMVEVQYELAKLYVERAQSYTPPAVDEYQWDYQAAMKLCEAIMLEAPNSQAAQKARILQQLILQKNLHMVVEEVQLPKQPFRLKLYYRNLTELFVRIIHLSPELDQQLNGAKDKEAAVALLRGEAPREVWKQLLPAEGDFQLHGIELPMPALEVGKYVVLMSDDPNFSVDGHAVSYAQLQVSKLAAAMPWGVSEPIAFALDRSSGAPLPGVKVRQIFREKNRPQHAIVGESFLTGEEGSVILEPAFKSGYEGNWVFKLGTDSVELPAIRTPWMSSSSHFRVGTRLFLETHTHQPGQLVRFGGIAFRESGDRFQKVRDTTLRVQLVKGEEEILQDTLVQVSAFGGFEGALNIPADETEDLILVAPGSSLLVRVAPHQTQAPFHVGLVAPDPPYAYWDSIAVSGYVLPFIGSDPPGKMEVSYRVLRQTLFPYWYSYSWWRPEYQNERALVANGKTYTDSLGRFQVSFVTIPDLELGENFRLVFAFSVEVGVVDTAGYVHRDTLELRLGFPQLAMHADLPPVSDVSEPFKVRLHVQDLNGADQPLTGRLRVYGLKEPDQVFRTRRWPQPDRHALAEQGYRDQFPQDVYAYEDDYRSWSADTLVVDTTFHTDQDSVMVLHELTRHLQGKYRLILTAEDAAGHPLRMVRHFTRYNAYAMLPPQPELLTYSLSQQKAMVGDTLLLRLQTSKPELWVLVQWGRRSHIAGTRILRVDQFQTQLSLPVTTSLRGGFFIRMATLQDNEWVSYTEQVEVPWEGQEPELSLKPGQRTYTFDEQRSLKLLTNVPDSMEVFARLVPLQHLPRKLPAFTGVVSGPIPRPWFTAGFGSNTGRLVAPGWQFEGGHAKLFKPEPAWQYLEEPLASLKDLAKLHDEIRQTEARRMQQPRQVMRIESRLLGPEHDFKERLQMGYLDHLMEAPKRKEVFAFHETSQQDTLPIRLRLQGKAPFELPLEQLSLAGKWNLWVRAHTRGLQLAELRKELRLHQPLMAHLTLPDSLVAGEEATARIRLYHFGNQPLKGRLQLKVPYHSRLNGVQDTLLHAPFHLREYNGFGQRVWSLPIPSMADSISWKLALEGGEERFEQKGGRDVVSHIQPLWEAKETVLRKLRLRLPVSRKALRKAPEAMYLLDLRLQHAFSSADPSHSLPPFTLIIGKQKRNYQPAGNQWEQVFRLKGKHIRKPRFKLKFNKRTEASFELRIFEPQP